MLEFRGRGQTRGLGGIHRGGRAGVEFLLGEERGLPLRGRGAARQRNASLVAAQFGVVGRDIADQGQQCRAAYRLGGVDTIGGGFDRAAIGAEQVQFPARIEAGLELVVREWRGGDAAAGARRRTVVGGRCPKPSTSGSSAPIACRRVARASRMRALALATFRLFCTASSISALRVGSPSRDHQCDSVTCFGDAALALPHFAGNVTNVRS